MNRHPSEPLTQEERELARLIARVGPHGEPPASLDAKILGAAHAAVERKPHRARKPRWPVAMGLAASAVLAVGIAWQLRPLQPPATPSSEAPAPAAAEMAAPTDAEPAMATAASAPADAVAQDSAAAAGIASESESKSASVSTGAPASPAPLPPSPAAKVLPPRTPSVTPPRRAARIPAPQAPTIQRQARDVEGYVSPMAPPPPPAPPAAVMAAPAPAAEGPAAFAAEPRAGTIAEGLSTNEATGYSAVRTATAKQGAARDESEANATLREQERAKQERARQAHTRQEQARQEQAGQDSAAQGSPARDRATLDRVEVTGTRLQNTDRQVPVSDDARLGVDEWLERVRTRYGLGDADAAKRSLLLFVHEHPSETVPSDLEPLLEK